MEKLYIYVYMYIFLSLFIFLTRQGMTAYAWLVSFFFLRFYLFVFREGKGKKKRRGETSMCSCLMHAPLLGTWPTIKACALDWEWNRGPFGLQADTQSTEPHQPQLQSIFNVSLTHKKYLVSLVSGYKNIKYQFQFSAVFNLWISSIF